MSQAPGIQQILDNTIDAVETFQNLFHGDEQQPYKKLDDSLVVLESHCDTLSHRTGSLIGEIKTLAMTAKSNYYVSTKKIDAWCGKASELLNAYINLCDESFFTRLNLWRADRYDAEEAKTQRDTLTKVLSDGMVEMSAALLAFEKSFASFDQASGKLIELQSALGQDNNLWKNLNKGIGFALNSMSFAISIIVTIRSGLSFAVMGVTAIGSASHIMLRIFNLNNKFKQLTENVVKSKAEIDHIKTMCVEEMGIIEDLKAQSDTANFLLTKKLLHQDAIISIKKLICLCDEYREKHVKKNVKNL